MIRLISFLVSLHVFKGLSQIVFYHPAQNIHVAENFTSELLFYIGETKVDRVHMTPVCGIAAVGPVMDCPTKDVMEKSHSHVKLRDSSYSVFIWKPKTLKFNMFNKTTFSLPITVQPSPTVESTATAAPTSPNFVGLQSAAPPTLFSESIVNITFFCCLESDPENTLSQANLQILPIWLTDSKWFDGSIRNSFRKEPDSSQVPRSLCSCDVTHNFCDSVCCCDTKCSADDKRSFNCDESSAILPPPLPSLPVKCTDLQSGQGHSTAAMYAPFPHAWFCLMFENNAFLGYHYEDLAFDKIDNRAHLKNHRKSKAKSSFSTSVILPRSYVQGMPLLSLSPNASEKESTPRVALFFPGKGPDGRCLRHSPLRFLSESDTLFCSITLTTPEQCRRNLDSYLSVLSYIPSEKMLISKIDSDSKFELLRSIACSCVIESTAAESNQSICSMDSESLCRDKPTTDNSEKLPCSCSEKPDNGLDNVVGVVDGGGSAVTNSWYCKNAVKSIDLNLGWSGNSIDWKTSNMSVILIDRVKAGDTFEQKFSVKFVKEAAPVLESAKKKDDEEWKWYRSGSTVKYSPAIESSGGNCKCLKPLPIRFGINSYASCPFVLKQDVFNDCDQLRGMAIKGLRTMVPAEYISKRPLVETENNDGISRDKWIIVQKLRRFPSAYPDCSGNNKNAEQTQLGRYPKLFRQFRKLMMTETGSNKTLDFCEYRGESRNITLNLDNATSHIAEVFWPAACSTKRICERVPSTLMLTVYRAVSGLHDGMLQNEIIGATVTFSVRDWLFDSSKQSHQALLSATIKFINIPMDPEKPTFVDRLVSMTSSWDILYPVLSLPRPESARSIAAACGVGLLLIAALTVAPPR